MIRERQPPSRVRRCVEAVLAVALVVVGIELVAFLLLRVTEGRWMTYESLGKLRSAARADADAESVQTAAAGKMRPQRAFRRLVRDVLHPYVGYVLDRRFQGASGPAGAEAYGFDLVGDLAAPKAPGKVVIAITGGSVAHGFGFHYGAVLQRELLRLRSDLRDVVVLDLALPGYKQPQQLMAAAWFLTLGAHFDALVNIDGFNDVTLPAQNTARGVFPFFPRDWDLRVRALDPRIRLAAGEITVYRKERAERAAAFSRFPLDRSMAASFLWRRLDRSAASRIAKQEVLLATARADRAGDYEASGPHRDYANGAAMVEDIAAVWKRSSLLMDGLARRSGAVYLHFLQPNQYVDGAKPMGPEERQRAVQAGGVGARIVPIAYPLLAAGGAELRLDGVRFTDLTWLFAGVDAPLYVDNCCHFNARGNELLARAVAAELAAALPHPAP